MNTFNIFLNTKFHFILLASNFSYFGQKRKNLFNLFFNFIYIDKMYPLLLIILTNNKLYIDIIDICIK